MKQKMKMQFLSVALIAGLASLTAKAETLVCEGQVDFYGQIQNFKVTVQGQGIGQAYTQSQVDRIEVQGASLEQPNVFENANDYWDGHANGMITAPGFAMTYENAFGCIRNVTITTDFRGDVKSEGETVGHVMQSAVIKSCKSAERACSQSK
jgi:hypothetical protein